MSETPKVRPGSRVYWHGTFPDTTKQGTVKQVGEIRHEVLWDGEDATRLVAVSALAKILRGKPVCPYPQGCGRCPQPGAKVAR